MSASAGAQAHFVPAVGETSLHWRTPRLLLETELSRQSAELGQYLAPITLEAVRELIPANAVLVEWYRYLPFSPKGKDQKTRWGNPHYLACVLKDKGDLVTIEIGEAEPIETLVHDFRVALSDPKHTDARELAIPALLCV